MVPPPSTPSITDLDPNPYTDADECLANLLKASKEEITKLIPEHVQIGLLSNLPDSFQDMVKAATHNETNSLAVVLMLAAWYISALKGEFQVMIEKGRELEEKLKAVEEAKKGIEEGKEK